MALAYGLELTAQDVSADLTGAGAEDLPSNVQTVREARRDLARTLLEREAWYDMAEAIRAHVDYHRAKEGQPKGSAPPLPQVPDEMLTAMTRAAVVRRADGGGWRPGSPFDDADVRGASHEAEKFWQGTWLEYAVLAALESVRADPRYGISDIVQGKAFRGFLGRGLSPNDPYAGEVDVAVICRARMVIFECKDRKGVDLRNEKFKIGTQKAWLGGRYARACVVAGGRGARDLTEAKRREISDQLEANCRSARAEPLEIEPGPQAWDKLVSALCEKLNRWASDPVPELG
ncbi:MAG: hypothetical protein U0531_21480 [Dehalococcoidia bacterium]